MLQSVVGHLMLFSHVNWTGRGPTLSFGSNLKENLQDGTCQAAAWHESAEPLRSTSFDPCDRAGHR